MIRLAKAHRRSEAGRPRGGPVARATGGARRSRATRAPRRTGANRRLLSMASARIATSVGDNRPKRRSGPSREVAASSARWSRVVPYAEGPCFGPAVSHAARRERAADSPGAGRSAIDAVGPGTSRVARISASQGPSIADLGASRGVTLGIADGAGRIGRNGMASHRRRKGVKTPKRSPFAVSTFSGSWMSTPRWRRKSTPSRSSAAATASSRRRP